MTSPTPPQPDPRGEAVPPCLRRASWLWPTVAYAPLRNVYADFARDFAVGQVAATTLHVTADAAYMAWLNGVYVGRGPARGWQASWPFDSHDLTPLLRAGVNRLAVRVHNPGRGTFRYVHAGMAGLLLAVEGAAAVLSDASWHCRLSPSRRRATPRLTIQLEDQEHVDLRRDESRWLRPGVELRDDDDLPPPDAFVDADDTLGAELRWAAPRQVRAFGSPPWHDVEPRGLPNLTGGRRGYRLVARGVVPSGPASSNPAVDLFDALDAARWRPADDAEPSATLADAGAGLHPAAIFDAGEATLGSILAGVAGGRPGGTLDLIAFEAREVDVAGRFLRPLLPDPRGDCRVGMALRLTLGGAPAEFESFHAYGHRYLLAVARDAGPSLTVTPGVRETLYPLADQGAFESSDPQLDATRAVCARTQRANMTDAYIDAWREQAQWWGDARVQFANSGHMHADDRLLRRGVAQIARQRTPGGLTYGHAPTAAQTCVLPDFSLTWLLTLHDHWWQTGSPALAVAHRGDAERVLAYFDGEGRGAGGLLRYDPRYWLFLDWAEIPKHGSPTLLNLWHVGALDLLSRTYRAAGEGPFADGLSAEARRGSRRLEDTLFDAGRGLWSDGLDEAGRRRETFGTHAQALAVLAGFDATPQVRGRVAAAVDLRRADPREPSCLLDHLPLRGRPAARAGRQRRAVRPRALAADGGAGVDVRGLAPDAGREPVARLVGPPAAPPAARRRRRGAERARLGGDRLRPAPGRRRADPRPQRRADAARLDRGELAARRRRLRRSPRPAAGRGRPHRPGRREPRRRRLAPLARRRPVGLRCPVGVRPGRCPLRRRRR